MHARHMQFLLLLFLTSLPLYPTCPAYMQKHSMRIDRACMSRLPFLVSHSSPSSMIPPSCPVHPQKHSKRVDETRVRLTAEERRERHEQLQRTMALLIHACTCNDANCPSNSCKKVGGSCLGREWGGRGRFGAEHRATGLAKVCVCFSLAPPCPGLPATVIAHSCIALPCTLHLPP